MKDQNLVPGYQIDDLAADPLTTEQWDLTY
jgi:hypothetical protein